MTVVYEIKGAAERLRKANEAAELAAFNAEQHVLFKKNLAAQKMGSKKARRRR